MATSIQKQQAHFDFEAMYQRGLRQRFWRAIRGSRSTLPVLDEQLDAQTATNVIDRGIETIRIETIKGSATGNRSFDRDFAPTRPSVGTRWTRIRLAYVAGNDLPAISVVKIDDAYYVVDGHHRVSVARFLGQVYIDAHVIEYNTTPNTQHCTNAKTSHCLVSTC